jgi:hypothetical protein
MYRTPTSMDINEDSMIYAAKILKGKVNRNSNQRVQITLSTDVAMEYLKNNPHLINEFDKPFMERPNLPNKLDFINYLKSQTTIKELVQKTNLPKTKIEHMTDKKNIYGDFRICYKCGMNADVVESGKDYCASCWFVNHTDMTIDEYERKNKDLEKERFRINYKKDKK